MLCCQDLVQHIVMKKDFAFELGVRLKRFANALQLHRSGWSARTQDVEKNMMTELQN